MIEEDYNPRVPKKVHKEVVARHVDFIIYMCGVSPKRFFLELDLESRYDAATLPERHFTKVNYYCLFRSGYGLADILAMSTEYLIDQEFFKLCYLYKGVDRKKATIDNFVKRYKLKPSLTLVRLVDSKEQIVRYWHRFDIYRFYKMDAMIPLLLSHPMRLWRYDNKAPNRETLCGGYNFFYTYRLAERILNISFPRLMLIETGGAIPTEAEIAIIEPYTKKYGDIRTWKPTFDEQLEACTMDTSIGEKTMPKGRYVVRYRPSRIGYSVMKTINPPGG